VDHILYALLAYCVVRELIFIYTVQKLVNKLMSRNYYDFKVSENAGTIDKTTTSFNSNDAGPSNDALGILDGFN
jgi:hypothetical protein